MKKIFIYSLLIIGLLSACEEVNKLMIGETIHPILTTELPQETIVLTEETAGDIFTSFEWTIADFGYPSADPEYTLEMDFEGNDFSGSINLLNTFDLSFEPLNAFINQKLITLGGEPGVASNIELRVTGSIEDQLIATSNVIKTKVMPYEIIIVYPKLYVTGDHNGWGFEEDDLLYSVADNEIFEGYIHMDNGEDWNGFKLSYQSNWDNGDAIVGDADASGTSGNLQVGNWGGNNMFATEGTGVYFIKANIPATSYTIYKTDWAITGDFNSWGYNDMTYDDVTDTWSLTVDMSSGGFKFIANQDWNKVFGDDEMDGILNKGTDGNNIQISEEGNYTITMDLSQAIYTYTIVKN